MIISRPKPDLRELENIARRTRLHCVEMANIGRCSHIGSSLSVIEILISLYASILKVDPKIPEDPTRDRLIISKGHASAAVYAVLAEFGFFPVDWLKTYYQNGSQLSGHVSHKIPGVEASTGSLGHGLPIAAGMAYSCKLDNSKVRVFGILSDGECDEGSNWEAALFAGHHRLDNLTVIIDYNKIQALGRTDEVLSLEPFKSKWEDFGWNVKEIDGHSFPAILKTLEELPFEIGKPSCLIAHTIKGKGVSFMENDLLWHYRTPQGKEFEDACLELGKKI
ncbi:MAG: transketolase [Candidatus Riflebacteria bacterium]|nr:transketolase [Candidatus Riflebacteria bacterium]